MAGKGDIQVIDDALLMEGIFDEEMIAENDVARINGQYNLVETAPRIRHLSLSFKKIAVVENLVGFHNLVKLCLDNNKITEIQNLGHLINLKWLDLSFNQISIIKGLEKLIHLEDLSLYRNEISVVEGLEQCTKLQCLSLGNNKITSMEQVKRLRPIRSLRMLTLAGNPVAKEGEYKAFVLAFIDSITYLDYVMIEPNERLIAKEQYHQELLDAEDKETVLAEKVHREQQLQQRVQELDGAGILFAHTIFDELFTDDTDMERLKHLPNTKEPLDAFRTNFKERSEKYIDISLERHFKRQKEIIAFEKSVLTMRSRDEMESSMLIDGYNKSKKAISDQITSPYSTLTTLDCQKLVKTLHEELDRVCDELMNIEVRQVEKFEALIDEFENRLNELKTETLEAQQFFFREVEGLEDAFSNSIRNMCMELIDRYIKYSIYYYHILL
jgi:hypothetical protein